MDEQQQSTGEEAGQTDAGEAKTPGVEAGPADASGAETPGAEAGPTDASVAETPGAEAGPTDAGGAKTPGVAAGPTDAGGAKISNVEAGQTDAGGAKTPGVGAIFSGRTGKFLLSVPLLVVALMSLFVLAPMEIEKTTSASDGLKNEKIQNALDEKIKRLTVAWATVKLINGIINELQSIEVGGGGEAGIVIVGGSVHGSVKPLEWLAPLDNILDKISNIFLWALGAVIFEKLLYTISGYVIFQVVIPVCMIISGIAIWLSNGVKKAELRIFFVTFVICVAVCGAIPLSFKLSETVETKLLAKHTEAVWERIRGERKNAEILKDEVNGIYSKVMKIAGSIPKLLSDAKAVGDAMTKDLLNTVMVFILTDIVIPILTILGLYWFTKSLARVIMGSGRSGTVK